MSPQPLSWEGDPTRVPLDRPPGVVDVIVPVAGAPDELARCVASLLAWTDLERHRLVIVLDGAQPPETDALVDRLAKERPEALLVLRNAERLRPVASGSRGAAAS